MELCHITYIDMNMALKNFELCISESYNLNQVYLYREQF